MGLIDIALAGLCFNITCPGDDNTGGVSLKNINYAQLANELKNEHLIITTLSNNRLSGSSENGTIGTGVAFDLLNILQEKFHFNYTIIHPKSNKWGSNQDDGVLEMLRKNEANLSVAFLPILVSNKYTKYITYSPSLDTGEWVVLMRRPKESASGSGLLAPFTLPVWLLILLSLFVVGPVIYFIIYLQAKVCSNNCNKEYCRNFSLHSCIWFVYGALLKQGTTLSPMTDSSRLLFATWWIFITILTAFYTANLTAFLTLSKFTLPISEANNIGEKRYKWVTTQGNALQDAININKTSLLVETLGRPTKIINEEDAYILEHYVKKNNYMFIREKPIVEYDMYEDYKQKVKRGIKEADRCTFVITKFSVVSFSRAFAYSKSFKYKSLFDSTIQHLVESGIIKYKLREELPDTSICPLDLGQKERQLKNSDLSLTYLIVGGGFVISLIIFCIELLIRYYIKWNDNNILPQKEIEENSKEKFKINLKHSKNRSPPPPYHSLFQPPVYNNNIKKRNINGREYWIFKGGRGETTLVPLRTPSALLFQYTN